MQTELSEGQQRYARPDVKHWLSRAMTLDVMVISAAWGHTKGYFTDSGYLMCQSQGEWSWWRILIIDSHPRKKPRPPAPFQDILSFISFGIPLYLEPFIKWKLDLDGCWDGDIELSPLHCRDAAVSNNQLHHDILVDRYLTGLSPSIARVGCWLFSLSLYHSPFSDCRECPWFYLCLRVPSFDEL